jgi:hypothetical protein
MGQSFSHLLGGPGAGESQDVRPKQELPCLH